MDTATAQVRAFNRTVTERIGALVDGYLDRGRPLGASRVLWEAPADVRDLRLRLGLDSGYLSRLLRVPGGRGAGDGRGRRRPTATTCGAVSADAPRAWPSARSWTRAATRWPHSLLEPAEFSRSSRPPGRRRWAVVERLLTAGLVEVARDRPGTSADAQFCLRQLLRRAQHALRRRVRPRSEPPADGSLLLVARLKGKPVGCGALKANGEIKRMWVAEDARGLGVGRRSSASWRPRRASRA